jgi:hypothetical protein
MRKLRPGMPPRQCSGSARIALLLLPALACAALGTLPRAAQAATPVPAPKPGGCLPGGDGYLRARVRGALVLDLAWSDAQMQCEGGTRPDGNGLRVSIAGPLQGGGRRLHFVFGIAGAQEGVDAQERATNLTLIFEGEQRIFATRGDARCTVDELHQRRIGELGGARRSWRIEARGFCIGPANALQGDARVLLTRFDFASVVHFEEEAHAAADAPTPTPAP